MFRTIFSITLCLAVLLVSGCANPREVTPDSVRTSQKSNATNVAPAPDLATNLPSAKVALNPALPSLFIAGDSTAARGAGEAQQGWAVPFASYFDSEKVNVVNCARGGRSSRTFVTEGLW